MNRFIRGTYISIIKGKLTADELITRYFQKRERFKELAEATTENSQHHCATVRACDRNISFLEKYRAQK